MKTLPEYWFVESPIDREHKQYEPDLKDVKATPAEIKIGVEKWLKEQE